MKTYILILLAVITFSCVSDSDSGLSQNANEVGQSGSLARFTTYNDYLYTVDNSKLSFELSTV
jgi:hypothetical protein